MFPFRSSSFRADQFCCSPVCMFFSAYCPVAISLSPTISVKRAFSLLASSMARFNLPSASNSTAMPSRAAPAPALRIRARPPRPAAR